MKKIFHTVKHLRPCQISGQIRNRIRSRFEDSARLLSKPAPGFEGCRWAEEVEILPPGEQRNAAEQILNGELTFLNATQQVGFPPDWQSPNLPKLWLYNLYYFEWLWTLDYEEAKEVTLDWISHHKPAKGQQGWEPYPISLRVMNLCGVFYGKYKKKVEADDQFVSELWKSIYLQVEWLSGHLETHILANHYLENGAALAFAGSCFEGSVAKAWLDKGLEILVEQIPEQILPDGVHFELSPMYHSRLLYLMAILQATGNQRLIDLVEEPLKRMANALAALCHPDGQIALFNDSAFGVYNEPRALIAYVDWIRGRRPDDSGRLTVDGGTISDFPANEQQTTNNLSFSLPDAGYYGWRDDAENYLICDFGKIGPDYQPGHAHADFGSYELSLNGCRVIVDAGVHDYEPSELRRYSRSTAAHNTVEVDGLNQCELWGTFRVARRGYPVDVQYKGNEDGMDVSGSHNGYDRLPGRPRHKRRIQWKAGESMLRVCDEVQSVKPVSVVSRIHLHPDCEIVNHEADALLVSYLKGQFRIDVKSGVGIQVVDGWYCPEFGVKFKNRVIELISNGVSEDMMYEVCKCE